MFALHPHSESISIADYFSVKKGEEVQYRPTVHYAYHPCDSAIMSIHGAFGFAVLLLHVPPLSVSSARSLAGCVFVSCVVMCEL